VSEPNPDAVFAGGEHAALIYEARVETGISGFLSGAYRKGKRKSGGRRGPVPGASLVPTLIDRSVKRKSGRPVRMHAFLDLLRSRLRKYQKPHKKDYYTDLVRDFRKDLWFLILAGYPVNSIRVVFALELPNLFGNLSFKGMVTSLQITIKEAKATRIDLDEEYLDLLKNYSAGPWAYNAPDWLRAQYGVPLEEPKSGGKDSRKGKGKGKDSGKDVAGEPAGAKSPEELGREDAFWTMWSKYKVGCPGAPDPTSEEVSLGVNLGISAILARREAAGVSVGAGTVEAPVVPVVGSGVVSSAVPAGPVAPVSGNDRALRIERLLGEIAHVEKSTGVSLNLTHVEFAEAVDSGLSVVLAKRQGSAGVPLAPVVPVPAGAGVSGNDSGGDSVGDGKPGDSHVVDSAVAKESGDLVAPVEPVKDLGADGVGGVSEPKALVVPGSGSSGDEEKEKVGAAPVEEPVVEVVPEVPDAPVVTVSRPLVGTERVIVPEVVVEPAKEKKDFSRRRSVLDPVPESEWLRYPSLGIAPGVRGGPDVDPWNIGGVPRVWKIDEAPFKKADTKFSDFYKSLGDAAPYLVEHVQDTKLGDWVLTGDNGFALYERFGGDSPKERLGWSGEGPDAKFNWGGEIFPTFFPELNAAPTNQREMYDLTLEQAKACFEEWNQRYEEDTPEISDKKGHRGGMSTVCPGPMLMDLVNRGMGPDYWKGHDTFLAHWLLGLAVRQACGFSTSWAHQGGKRYIPLGVVPSLEKVSYACKNFFAAIAPWRSVSPIYTETLAPRRASENLPGHVWAAGLGYFRVEDYERFKAYAGKRNENHKDLNGLRAEERMMMTNWCLDIFNRVSTRNWVSHEKAPDGGHYFLDTWDPRGDQLASASDGVNRLTCSPLFCDSGRVSGYFSRMSHSLLNNDLLVGNGALRGLLWPPKSGFSGLEETWAKLPLDIHMYSLYAVGYYLQHLENRRQRDAKGGVLRGIVAPPDYLLPEDKVPFPPVQIANSAFRRWFKQMVIDKELSGS
jgi:hypothetical protein